MITNASPWDNLKFDPEGVEEVRRKFFGTLYNTYSFFALYANVDGFDPATPQVPFNARPEIDRWILSVLNTLIKDVDGFYADYEPTRAGRAIETFVDEHLSNWYVRLNRKRFWGGAMDEDKLSAYQTLYQCLVAVAKLMAPIAPFYADRLYCDLAAPQPPQGELEVAAPKSPCVGFRGLDGGFRGLGLSVHLSDFPVCDETVIDSNLETCMQYAQDISSMLLALRRRADKKVRQPLPRAVVPTTTEQACEQIKYVAELIKNEVNIKELDVLAPDVELENIVKRIKPNFKTLGKRYGKLMKDIAAAFAEFDKKTISEIEKAGNYSFSLNGETVELEPSDYEILTEDMPGWLVANNGALTVALDITVTPELQREGVARELVNRIQNIRKSNGYEITDKISVTIQSSPETDESVTTYKDYIANQVLAKHIEIAALTDGVELDMDDLKLLIKVEKL
jgi:isoleucyl-tRNA synthetase